MSDTTPQLVTIMAGLLCFAEHLRGVTVDIEANFTIAQAFVATAVTKYPDITTNEKT